MEQEKIKKRNNQRTYYETCDKCRGSRRITCSKCKGSALLACSTCRTKGYVTCAECCGKGYLTNILTTQITTIPSFYLYFTSKDFDTVKYTETAIRNLKTIPQLNLYGRAKREQITYDEKSRTVRELYDLFVPFAEFSVAFNGKEFVWIVYGKDPQIFHTDDMIKTLLESDIENLCNIANKALSTPFLLLSSKEQVSIFLESEINQKILEHGYNASSVRDHIGDSYATKTLQAFEKLVKSYCLKSDIFWFAIAFLIAFTVDSANIEQGYIKRIGYLFFIFMFYALIAKYTRALKIRIYWGKCVYRWVKSEKLNKCRWLLYPLTGLLSVMGLNFLLH